MKLSKNAAFAVTAVALSAGAVFAPAVQAVAQQPSATVSAWAPGDGVEANGCGSCEPDVI